MSNIHSGRSKDKSYTWKQPIAADLLPSLYVTTQLILKYTLTKYMDYVLTDFNWLTNFRNVQTQLITYCLTYFWTITPLTQIEHKMLGELSNQAESLEGMGRWRLGPRPSSVCRRVLTRKLICPFPPPMLHNPLNSSSTFILAQNISICSFLMSPLIWRDKSVTSMAKTKINETQLT